MIAQCWLLCASRGKVEIIIYEFGTHLLLDQKEPHLSLMEKDYKRPEILSSELDAVLWWNFGLSPLCPVRA